jgi:NADP-dependent 3-hydroxy acid dehydrogenase YdfG
MYLKYSDTFKQLRHTCTMQVDIFIMQVDLTDLEAVKTVLQRLPDGMCEIDILINNAGLALGTAPGHETDMEVGIAHVFELAPNLLRYSKILALAGRATYDEH